MQRNGFSYSIAPIIHNQIRNYFCLPIKQGLSHNRLMTFIEMMLKQGFSYPGVSGESNM